MKKFLGDITIALIFITTIGGVFEYYAATHDNNFRYKYQYLNEHSKDIKILVLGNSFFENSLNSHLLGDSAFNAALSGRWIYYDYHLLARYIPQMTNLKVVLFPLGYFMPFFSYHNHPIDGRQKKYIYHYLTFMHIPYDRYPESILYHSSFFSNMIFDQQENHTCDSLGYDKLIGRSTKWEVARDIYPSMVQKDKELSSDTAECIYFLTQMAEMCYLHHVRFIVVTPPCHDVYLSYTEEQGHRIRQDIIHQVQSKYPLEYFDYLQDIDYRADSLYFNCSHLNHDGASKFALRLKKDFL